jgi:hypothetical protein
LSCTAGSATPWVMACDSFYTTGAGVAAGTKRPNQERAFMAG